MDTCHEHQGNRWGVQCRLHMHLPVWATRPKTLRGSSSDELRTLGRTHPPQCPTAQAKTPSRVARPALQLTEYLEAGAPSGLLQLAGWGFSSGILTAPLQSTTTQAAEPRRAFRRGRQAARIGHTKRRAADAAFFQSHTYSIGRWPGQPSPLSEKSKFGCTIQASASELDRGGVPQTEPCRCIRRSLIAESSVERSANASRWTFRRPTQRPRHAG